MFPHWFRCARCRWFPRARYPGRVSHWWSPGGAYAKLSARSTARPADAEERPRGGALRWSLPPDGLSTAWFTVAPNLERPLEPATFRVRSSACSDRGGRLRSCARPSSRRRWTPLPESTAPLPASTTRTSLSPAVPRKPSTAFPRAYDNHGNTAKRGDPAVHREGPGVRCSSAGEGTTPAACAITAVRPSSAPS